MNKECKIEIKAAKPENAAELLAIYKYYVENTAITFEIQTPTLEEFTARIEKTLKKVSVYCCRCRWKNCWICVCRTF